MSIHVKSTSRLYKVDDDSQISVRATIGDAQGGGWVVAWEKDDIIAKGGAPATVLVGSGEEARGKTLHIVVTAVDIRPETNRLSCMVSIMGGPDGHETVVLRVDGDAGDSAVFTTAVMFQ